MNFEDVFHIIDSYFSTTAGNCESDERNQNSIAHVLDGIDSYLFLHSFCWVKNMLLLYVYKIDSSLFMVHLTHYFSLKVSLLILFISKEIVNLTSFYL